MQNSDSGYHSPQFRNEWIVARGNLYSRRPNTFGKGFRRKMSLSKYKVNISSGEEWIYVCWGVATFLWVCNSERTSFWITVSLEKEDQCYPLEGRIKLYSGPVGLREWCSIKRVRMYWFRLALLLTNYVNLWISLNVFGVQCLHKKRKRVRLKAGKYLAFLSTTLWFCAHNRHWYQTWCDFLLSPHMA